MATTDELVYSVGLDWDKMGFESMDASIDKMVKSFAVATAAAAAAAAAIFKIGSDFANSTDELIKTSERINTTTADIEKLTFAAEDNGATMQDVTGALGALAKAQQDVLRGSGDFEAWGRLGVNPSEYENTSDLLLAISDSVKDLNSNEAVDLMQRVGISPTLLQTLQQGSDGLNALGSELEAMGGITTADMQKASQDFMSGWQRASSMFDSIMKQVGGGLLEETINPAIEAFNKFLSKNMKQISAVLTSIFEALADAAEFVFAVFKRISQPFISFVNLIGGVEEAIKLVGIAFLVMQRQAIIAMLPAILAVGALFLAFDDLMTFIEGGDSVIGSFFEKFGLTEEANAGVKKLKDTFAEYGGVINTVIGGWKNLFDWINYYIDKLMEKIQPFIDAMSNVVDKASDIAGGVSDFASDAWAGTKNFFGFGSDESQPVTQTVTNNSAIEIKIDGAGSPKEVGEEVRRVLLEETNKSAQRAGY